MSQELKFSWRIVLATVIGFLGSAFGTVGGIGGGGIFVPMLTLIVGFDTKSAAALSKCITFFVFIFLFCFNLYAIVYGKMTGKHLALDTIVWLQPSFLFFNNSRCLKPNYKRMIVANAVKLISLQAFANFYWYLWDNNPFSEKT